MDTRKEAKGYMRYYQTMILENNYVYIDSDHLTILINQLLITLEQIIKINEVITHLFLCLCIYLLTYSCISSFMTLLINKIN